MSYIANNGIAGFDHVLIGFYNSIAAGNMFQWWVEGIIEAFWDRNGSLCRVVGN
ncbi:MAG: hypothetical protein ACI4F0_05215 [Agathobacter sp.]